MRPRPATRANASPSTSANPSPADVESDDASDDSDLVRAEEFARLDGVAYCDHAGAPPYSESLVRECMTELTSKLLGNPHSFHGAASTTAAAVAAARDATLQHLNAPVGEYVVVFTSGATAALRLVAESFPWSPSSEFRYTASNHTSVVGIRAAAAHAGARVAVVDVLAAEASESESEPSVRVRARRDDDGEERRRWRIVERAEISPQRTPSRRPFAPSREDANEDEDVAECLFAYPAECNLSGERFHPSVASAARAADEGTPALSSVGTPTPPRPRSRRRWRVLCDAAKCAGTRPPDLSREDAPDFVALRTTRCSATRRVSARSSLGATRSRLFVRDTSAGASPPAWTPTRIFSAADPARRGSRTVRSTSPPSPPSRLDSGGWRTSREPRVRIRARARRRWTRARAPSRVDSHVDSPRFVTETARASFGSTARRGSSTATTRRTRSREARRDRAAGRWPSPSFDRMDPPSDASASNAPPPRRAYTSELDVVVTPARVNARCVRRPGDRGERAPRGRRAETTSTSTTPAWRSASFEPPSARRPRARMPIDSRTSSRDTSKSETLRFVTETCLGGGRSPEGRGEATRVTRVAIFPMKGAAAYEPPGGAWPVGPCGLLYDREWALASPSGEILCPRRVPDIARLRPEIDLVRETLRVRVDGAPGTGTGTGDGDGDATRRGRTPGAAHRVASRTRRG